LVPMSASVSVAVSVAAAAAVAVVAVAVAASAAVVGRLTSRKPKEYTSVFIGSGKTISTVEGTVEIMVAETQMILALARSTCSHFVIGVSIVRKHTRTRAQMTNATTPPSIRELVHRTHASLVVSYVNADAHDPHKIPDAPESHWSVLESHFE